MRRKTYQVTMFAELRRRIEEARKKAEEETRKVQAGEKASDARAAGQSGKEFEVNFDVDGTGPKNTIDCFDTRQVVMAIAFREKGQGGQVARPFFRAGIWPRAPQSASTPRLTPASPTAARCARVETL